MHESFYCGDAAGRPQGVLVDVPARACVSHFLVKQIINLVSRRTSRAQIANLVSHSACLLLIVWFVCAFLAHNVGIKFVTPEALFGGCV
jgi:hypothetical protein